MAIRESIRGLSKSAARLQRLRDAFSRIMGLGDDRGYEFFASLHGLPYPYWCQHGTELFLPWHRAYLYYLELALQSRLGPRFTELPPTNPNLTNVGIPWWDWASDESHQEGIPRAYDVSQVGGQPNPLSSARVASCPGGDDVAVGVWSAFLVRSIRQHSDSRIRSALTATGALRTRRDPDEPDELPRQTTIDNVLAQPTFQSFSNSLEGIHGFVHGWVAGSMSLVETAGYDPIFYSHHSMVDRLWYIWQNRGFGQNPPDRLMNTVLTPFPMTVAQTLDISQLSYDYAVEATG